MKHKNTLLTLVFTALLIGFAGITTSKAQTNRTDPTDRTVTNQESYQDQEDAFTFGQRIKELQEATFVGSWEGVFTPGEGGPPPFRILFTFGAGGTVVATDAGPPNPHLASSEHGAWERVGNNVFLVTYKQLFFDKDGNLDGLFKARVKFRLTRGGTEINGRVIVDLYDAKGNPLFSAEGKINCTKIRVEPLD